MKPKLTFLGLLYGSALLAQTYLPLTDNLVINSGDQLKFLAGDYAFPDAEKDGVIQLIGVQNAILDGDSVTITGEIFEGYFIYLENCSHITIKNFDLAKGYFYAVYALHSDHITVENCTFSENKRDDEGWITIFDGPAQALGGGVFMDDCSNATIQGNVMQDQNDGVALYNCDSVTVQTNNLSWNTSYGVRMYHTHHSAITENDCSHINRPLTDPSDCASILLLDAFHNTVTHNDCTYSGDGIFLNNYYTMEPANNYFAYNDCSFSPHNAIEAVFSDGNIFKHNTCNSSNYGFWLGYSFNTVVDSNEIRGNGGLDGDGGGGIAIDRGYQNTITNNDILQNSNGIKLWEGGLINPYTNNSKDYLIAGNTFFGNRLALSFTATEMLTCEDNIFEKNNRDIYIDGSAGDNLIQQNTFGMNVGYYMENHSFDDIQAVNNSFPEMPIPGFLDGKIYDASDAIGPGFVHYTPYQSRPPLEIVYTAPSDLCEAPAIWDAYRFVEDGAPTTVSWDTNEKVAGDASVFLATESGWDVHLHYFPGDYHHALWKLDEEGSIRFWMKVHITDPDNPWGVQESFVRIGDACGNFYQYNNDYFQAVNPFILNNALDQWAEFEIPLNGNTTWIRTQDGTPDLDSISYITFNVDVWEYGYELWLDSVSVPAIPTGTEDLGAEETPDIRIFPNPGQGAWTVQTDLPESDVLQFDLYDLQGRLLKSWGERTVDAGLQETILGNEDLPQGVFLLKLTASRWVKARTVIR